MAALFFLVANRLSLARGVKVVPLSIPPPSTTPAPSKLQTQSVLPLPYYYDWRRSANAPRRGFFYPPIHRHFNVRRQRRVCPVCQQALRLRKTLERLTEFRILSICSPPDRMKPASSVRLRNEACNSSSQRRRTSVALQVLFSPKSDVRQSCTCFDPGGLSTLAISNPPTGVRVPTKP